MDAWLGWWAFCSRQVLGGGAGLPLVRPALGGINPCYLSWLWQCDFMAWVRSLQVGVAAGILRRDQGS
jgi:hypothetical protein